MKRSDSEVPKARLLKDVLVRVKAAYPDAALSEDIVRRLYPMWVKLWRKGFNAEHIAATTCSCDDGRTVMPSLAADLELGSVKLRIPKGAEPGVPFGFEALRESGARNKLLSKLNDAKQSVSYYEILESNERNALAFARGRPKVRHERMIERYADARQKWIEQVRLAEQALRVFDEAEEEPPPRPVRTRKPAVAVAAPPAAAPKGRGRPPKAAGGDVESKIEAALARKAGK
jgi:hypothetical protein